MGFDFTVIAPPYHLTVASPLSLDVGVSFLVSSSVFLLMIVQQLAVILVFSEEGVRARPSTPPSWFLIRNKHLFLKISVKLVNISIYLY